jgi:hypothetical protein
MPARRGFFPEDLFNAFIVHPTAVREDGTTTITAEDLRRVRDDMRRQQWRVPQPVAHFTDWVTTAGDTTPNFEWEFRRPDRATEILGDIYRFRDQLMRAGFRQRDIDERFAYRVSPEEYRVLQEYVAQEGMYRGPVYSAERGTMTVMGLTVLPSR